MFDLKGRLGERGPAISRRRVIELKADDPRWHAFTADNSQALPYHHPAWLQVIQEAYHYRSATLGCVDEAGRLAGVLPLIEKKGLLSGRHLSSLPHSPVAGPLAADQDAARALLSAAAAQVDNSSARWLQLKVLGPQIETSSEGLGRAVWDPLYVLRLPGPSGELRFGGAKDHSSIMRAVRKAQRTGVRVRQASSPQDLRRWYALYLQTVREHAVPPRPLRMFEVMWEILAPLDRVRLLLAERNAGGRTTLLAGCAYLVQGRTIICGYNGRDRSQLEFRPNDALHYKAITDANAAGFHEYNFGDVNDSNKGLARFKAKWGADPVEVHRYHYPAHQELEQGIFRPGKFRTAAQWSWRRLPLPVTRGLGGWIYGHL